MILDGVEIIDGTPLIYIKELSALACADLHLGYEGVMAENGIFLPKANLKKIKEVLHSAILEKSPNMVIIDGDIKNEFSKVHVEEFNELYDFVNFLKESKVNEIVLIKGNHDNFVDRLKGSLGIKIYKQEAQFGKYLFFHGEQLPSHTDAEWAIMGHVHPAISLYTSIGIKEKLRCFLYGTFEGKKFIILPAMNYFAEGVSVNLEDVSELSPVFSKINVDSMRALCIGDGETLDFGSIGELKRLSR
ncbi:MAG: metallophosphoesterase [Candidatus Micrarchaeia archaeon]|jgi:putative SbcD/Mre11-related phosphoesterase